MIRVETEKGGVLRHLPFFLLTQNATLHVVGVLKERLYSSNRIGSSSAFLTACMNFAASAPSVTR